MTAEQSSSSLSVERGKEAEVAEVGEEDEVEDISDERYAKMHSKGERLKKKIDRKQEQSTKWQLRSNYSFSQLLPSVASVCSEQVTHREGPVAQGEINLSAKYMNNRLVDQVERRLRDIAKRDSGEQGRAG